MPDLHKDSVHAFWDSYDRRTLYRIIVALERVEHWALDDDPVIEKALIRLGETLARAKDFELKDPGILVRILSQTCASKALRILQAVDMAKPGTASQLLMHAEEVTSDSSTIQDPYAKLFLRRNLVFERLQLLSRVFAPQRVSLVLKALEYQSE